MADLMTAMAGLLVGFVQLLIGLALAVFAIYLGINLLDKLTVGIEEMDELKKGNVAVGILFAAVVISIAIVIQSGVVGMTLGIKDAGSDIIKILLIIGKGILAVIVGMIFAVIGIFIAIKVMQRILAGTVVEAAIEKVTKEDTVKNINLFEELKNRNVAVGVMLAGILIGVSIVIQAGVQGIVQALGVAF